MTLDKKLFAAFSIFLVASTASAKDGDRDLSAGILFPANHDSVFFSPAPLGGMSEKELALAAGVGSMGSGDNVPSLALSYTRGGSKTGFGFGLTRSAGSDGTVGGAAAIGHDFGGVELGLQTDFSIPEFNGFGLDFGIRYASKGKGVTIGAVIPNITSFSRSYTLGIGSQVADWLILEADLDIQHELDSLGVNSATLDFGVLILPTRELTLMVGSGTPLVPEPTFDLNGISLGAAYRISRNFGVFALFSDGFGLSTLGAQLFF